MTNSTCFLERCDAIASLSTSMLDAARAEDWTEVDRLRDRATAEIDDVRMLSASVTLTPDEHKTKFAHLRRVLVNAGQIQGLAQPWMRSYGRWFVFGAAPRDPFRDVSK